MLDTKKHKVSTDERNGDAKQDENKTFDWNEEAPTSYKNEINLLSSRNCTKGARDQWVVWVYVNKTKVRSSKLWNVILQH